MTERIDSDGEYMEGGQRHDPVSSEINAKRGKLLMAIALPGGDMEKIDRIFGPGENPDENALPDWMPEPDSPASIEGIGAITPLPRFDVISADHIIDRLKVSIVRDDAPVVREYGNKISERDFRKMADHIMRWSKDPAVWQGAYGFLEFCPVNTENTQAEVWLDCRRENLAPTIATFSVTREVLPAIPQSKMAAVLSACRKTVFNCISVVTAPFSWRRKTGPRNMR